jgi:hypothetical protein
VSAVEVIEAPAPYRFEPQDRPAFPGSPYSPPLTLRMRIAYGSVSVLSGVAATFPNALTNVNQTPIAGSFGVFVAQVALLPAVFVAFNATANLTLVRARIQFGIPRVILPLLGLYALAALVELVAPSFAGEAVLRAVNGMTGAGLVAQAIAYALTAIPADKKPMAVVLGISTGQLGIPLARLVPVEALASGGAHGLHLVELGVALVVIAAFAILPLPPTDRSKAFERLDFATIGLMIPGALLLSFVLAEGRYLWWTDTPWLGVALAAGLTLVGAAMAIEHHRASPLLQTRWIATRDIIRFAAVAILVRLALAEQTYGSVGLLSAGALNNDQLRVLFGLVAAAIVVGIVVSMFALTPTSGPWLITAAALIIAVGAGLDSGANNLTRPAQLYLSQALIGLGTTLFIGPALGIGIVRVLQRGPQMFITTIVLFSTTQNIGGLAGSALLGSLQIARARAHASALSDHLTAADPQVAARLQAGVAQLNQALNREAGVLAYNDVFIVVSALALATAAYVALPSIANAVRRLLTTPKEP